MYYFWLTFCERFTFIFVAQEFTIYQITKVLYYIVLNNKRAFRMISIVFLNEFLFLIIVV